MRRGARSIVAVALFVMLPMLAEGQSSFVSLAAPQWGATRNEVADLYGEAVESSLRFLLYRPHLVYGRSEARFEFRVDGLVRIVVGIEPSTSVTDHVIRDMTTRMRVPPTPRQTPRGRLYIWENDTTYAEYGPVPPPDSKDWVTLQITDIRRINR